MIDIQNFIRNRDALNLFDGRSFIQGRDFSGYAPMYDGDTLVGFVRPMRVVGDWRAALEQSKAPSETPNG